MNLEDEKDADLGRFEPGDDFDARLQAALAPARLSVGLEQRLLGQIAAHPGLLATPVIRLDQYRWRPLIAGIAATLLLCTIPRPDSLQYSSDALFSQRETAEIARTVALLNWEPPLAPAIEDAARSVERIRERLSGDTPSENYRFVHDDWDLPPAADAHPGGSSLGPALRNTDA